MPYKFVEGLSVADVAFTAEGKTLEELFESAALATTNVMVKDLKKIELKKRRKITVSSNEIEKLLFNFLQEIIYLKDAELLILGKYEIKIRERNNTYSLVCIGFGEKLDMSKHELVVDVKAVTYHLFEVKNDGKKWTAQVILDI
ncbi:MAG: archease [Candidatus Aenigmarchaeota archaeon]|nr:archease [Candidatus Aenigmarchaeota archaeon]